MRNQKLFTDLTDEQAEKVVGGVGSTVPAGAGGAGAGTVGWFGDGPGGIGNPLNHGLDGSGQFVGPTDNLNAAVGVKVPNKG